MQPLNIPLALMLILAGSLSSSCKQMPQDIVKNDSNSDEPTQKDPMLGKWSSDHRSCKTQFLDVTFDDVEQDLRISTQDQECILRSHVPVSIDGGIYFSTYCKAHSTGSPTIKSVSFNVNDRDTLQIERYSVKSDYVETLRRCVKSVEK